MGTIVAFSIGVGFGVTFGIVMYAVLTADRRE